MVFAVIGDVHGAFDALGAALAREPDAAFWLCVGDVASDSGAYPSPARPFYFIHGNNEDFDVIARLAAGERVAEHLHLVPDGVLVSVGGLRIAGLGGTFAPTWYDTAPGDLPYPGLARPAARGRAVRDDKRRHLVRLEVEACKALAGLDVFLSHEAPRPYWVGSGRARNDAGKQVVNEILAAVRPRLHFFGHHHRFSEATCEGVPSIGLPPATDGYLVVDASTWRWELKGSEP